MAVLVATAVGVRRRRRWVFRELEVVVEPADVVAVVGPPGSGRTTALLALAGRFRLSEGAVCFPYAGGGAENGEGAAGKGRRGAALGYVGGVSQPEPVLTVAEHVHERLALLGRSGRLAADVPLLGLDPGARGWQLSPYERQVLGIVLALLADPAVVALDGIDDGLDEDEQNRLWAVVQDLAAAGIAVVVTGRRVDPGRVTTLVELSGQVATLVELSGQVTTLVELSGRAAA